MDAITVTGISKRYGDVTALHEISFAVGRGELVTLLGPSGCGKTTTLRAIAGLEKPDSGRIAIHGRDVFSTDGAFVPPEKRGLGMVFQSYAIWPHMTVFQNVAYGLVAQRVPAAEIRRRVEQTLAMVGLAGLSDRPATRLSGGQQQRVALARSLVGEPRVLLLDEPLSNLDAKLRERMRVELKQLQKRLGVTAVYVTHDQAEALALSDRIIVMDGGRIVQEGDGREIYRNPRSRFVVDFVGNANLVEGVVADYDGATRRVRLVSESGLELQGTIPHGADDAIGAGKHATAALRPEDIRISLVPRPGTNVWAAQVTSDLFLGNARELLLDAQGHVLKVQVTSEQPLPPDGKVWLTAEPTAIHILA
jgi:ABC-type Fe3+/spermidine/putrescine transport system ATPase subunit